MDFKEQIFRISSIQEFTALAIEIFRYQYHNNAVYRRYVDARRIEPGSVMFLEQIPFLPIEFFKSYDVVSYNPPPQAVFRSSGTTGMQRSRHQVADLNVYRQSISRGFERVFGSPEGYQFLALTPNVEQAIDSSLVFMIQHLMDQSSSPENGFFLANPTGLQARLMQRRSKGLKVMLIGLTYALIDFAARYPGDYAPLIVVETGGMKGKRKEVTRDELHSMLKPAFGVTQVLSEYGMSELLSQAWSTDGGFFTTPSWMKIMVREINDPLSFARIGETGGLNIIDLANFNSCSFIATQDLGRLREDGKFEVLGRYSEADTRGCNLLI